MKVQSPKSNGQSGDPETVAQRDELHGQPWRVRAGLWLAFKLAVAWVNLCGWFNYRRDCSWCRRRWIGGNPFARQITHGICKRCAEAWGAPTEFPPTPPATSGESLRARAGGVPASTTTAILAEQKRHSI